MAKESALQKKVLGYLRNSVGGHWIKIHVSSYQAEGDPDIVGCYNGRFYAFELKVGNNKASELQEYKLQHIREAGGTAMVIRSIEELERVFNGDEHTGLPKVQ